MRAASGNVFLLLSSIKNEIDPNESLPYLQYAYRDRKNKKRTFRALWIQRINAAARLEGLSYSQLMGALKKAGIEINRKVLADLAMNQPAAFKAIVEQAKKSTSRGVKWVSGFLSS